MGGVSLYITHTHTHTHTHIHTHTYLTTFQLHLPVCLPVSTFLFVLPSILPIFKPPIQSTSPQFFYSWYLMMLIFPSSCHLCFPILSQIFSRLFPKISYNDSYEYVVTCTCVRYLVVHVTDSEPSVHAYSNDTASQTALLHIITHGKRYTEHTVDVHSNRT
jgi:hypothetical protein